MEKVKALLTAFDDPRGFPCFVTDERPHTLVVDLWALQAAVADPCSGLRVVPGKVGA
jgi:hypothetical protein